MVVSTIVRTIIIYVGGFVLIYSVYQFIQYINLQIHAMIKNKGT